MDVVVVIDAPRELPILINDLANETAFARRQKLMKNAVVSSSRRYEENWDERLNRERAGGNPTHSINRALVLIASSGCKREVVTEDHSCENTINTWKAAPGAATVTAATVTAATAAATATAAAVWLTIMIFYRANTRRRVESGVIVIVVVLLIVVVWDDGGSGSDGVSTVAAGAKLNRQKAMEKNDGGDEGKGS
uniref:Uncharacterized protein n=1 Tax=Vespula pensylvanica TaxID=30213 RepID=A0A834UB65_VESPE|nr:hypothetical protein H0235_007139 [Vespula pensylvanica]